MPYFPKSTVIYGEARKGEFVITKTGSPYIGPYMMTNDNRYFSGNNSIQPGPELSKSTPSTKDFGQTIHVRKYKLIKNNIYYRHKKHLNVYPSKTIPTEKDYKRGYFIRYYLLKANDIASCYEIRKKQHEEKRG